MKFTFKKRGDRDRKQQFFDKSQIFITKMGKTYNVYDAIQEANIDTDVNEVMKKYNMQQDDAIQYMEERGGIKGIFEDITELQKNALTIPEMIKAGQKAQTMFEQLPSEIKQKYGNDLTKFFQDMEKENQKQETEPLKKDEVKSDETK